jgi:putative ABC transport system substrate-binding protein
MKRRSLLAFAVVLGTCLAGVVGVAAAQQPDKIYRIGFVEAGSMTSNQHFLTAFLDGLRELGYIDGSNVVVDTRWAEGQTDRFPELLADIIKLRPDVIVVASSAGAVAAKKTVKSIPVVFIASSDPVDLGLAASRARPGGNLTGLARVFGEGLLGKAVQLLKDIVPAASRMAILWNPASAVNPGLSEAQTAMLALRMTPLPIEVRDRSGLKNAFSQIRRQRADSLLVITDPLTLRNRDAIVSLVETERIPAVYEFAEFARAGGLIAYSASVPELFRRAAVYVDKILKGAKPGELPIEQPTKFELVINLKTARALGLTIPQSLLVRADEVIE